MVRETCNVDIKCTRLNNQFRCRNLCDIKQEGKLNPEQFALAMWLIAKKQSGKDPPAALTPDMVPPSMRPKVQNDVSQSSTATVLLFYQ